MPENVYLEDTDEMVTLAPCPQWCQVDERFPNHAPESFAESFSHYGSFFVLNTEQGEGDDSTASEVAVTLWARSEQLRTAAGQPYVEINLSSKSKGDLWMALTPAQACQVGTALLDLARATETGRLPGPRHGF